MIIAYRGMFPDGLFIATSGHRVNGNKKTAKWWPEAMFFPLVSLSDQTALFLIHKGYRPLT